MKAVKLVLGIIAALEDAQACQFTSGWQPAPLMAPEGLAGEQADIFELMRRFRWLVGKVTADRWFAATVLPQLHVLAWGNRRGV